MNKDIIKLAIDLAKGKVQTYSASESNETLRKAFADLMEFSLEGNGKIDRKTFRKHKVEIFEIIEEILNETIDEGVRSQFESLAEYRNLAWGDENLFRTPENNIFRVSLVSDGNGNIRRQRLRDGQEFSVSVDTYAVKVGEEFHRFLAGRVDWTKFIEGITKSFTMDLNQKIADAVYNSYGTYGATYHNTFTTAPTEDEIVEMAMHIEARTGEKVAIYGTKLALRKLAPSNITSDMNNERNTKGYYGQIAGIEMREIAQSHKYGTDEFAVDNKFVLLLPQNADKMIKIVNEGDAIVQDNQGGLTSDMMQEYFIANRFGVALISTKVFGFAKFA